MKYQHQREKKTNLRTYFIEILGKRKKFQKFQKPKLEFATWADNYLQSIYIVLGVISNL